MESQGLDLGDQGGSGEARVRVGGSGRGREPRVRAGVKE